MRIGHLASEFPLSTVCSPPKQRLAETLETLKRGEMKIEIEIEIEVEIEVEIEIELEIEFELEIVIFQRVWRDDGRD